MKTSTKIGIGLAVFLGLLIILGSFSLILILMNRAFLTEIPFMEKRVAILNIRGIVFESRPIVDLLHKYEKNQVVGAIVLRINSGGGSAAASQEIYQEIKKVRENGKKVVASIESVGASGAYYIAMAADSIVANPSTAVGSIGVLIETPNFQELLNKIGIRLDVIKSGKYKDIGSVSREMTEEEKKILQDIIDDVHNQFVEDIANCRQIEIDKVKKLANGRIFTARQALGYGLIDKLGTLDDAVNLAGRLAGIKGKPKTLEEEEEDFGFFRLFSKAYNELAQPKMRIMYR